MLWKERENGKLSWEFIDCWFGWFGVGWWGDFIRVVICFGDGCLCVVDYFSWDDGDGGCWFNGVVVIDFFGGWDWDDFVNLFFYEDVGFVGVVFCVVGGCCWGCYGVGRFEG